MFTFDTTPVKFVGLLVMFAWCTVWGVASLARPQGVRARVSGALHLLMSVVMLLMVWTGTWRPLVSVVPMPVLVGVFALATAWFAVWALRDQGVGWLARWGHTIMFGAMTWHLIAMGIKRSHMSGAGSGDMAAWMVEASRPGGALWVVGLIGIPFMVYLLVAGVLDVRRALVPAAAASGCHGERPGTRAYRASALADAAMNLGMFWMSTGLMTAVAPFMAFLAF